MIETMDRNEFINNKFITVAGRASSMDEFATQIKKKLYDNFGIVAIHGLGEFGIDDKERYLAFITGESATGHTFTGQEQRFVSEGLGAHTHDNLDDAYDYSKKNYPTFGEEEELKQRKFESMSEKFPPVTAEESERYAIFEALMATDKTHFVRCLLEDKPCLVIVSITTGADEMRVRPLAVMLNEELESKIEFPNPEEE